MCEFVVFFVTSNENYFKQLHNYTIRSISSDIVVLGLLCCMTAGDARITQLCQWIKLFHLGYCGVRRSNIVIF